jgi:signal peptidase I
MMAQPHDTSQYLSPWFSIWTRPRDTISYVLARDPRRHVLLLAAIGGIAALVNHLFQTGGRAGLVGWPVAVAIAVGGAFLGIVGLYLNGLLLRLSGTLFGGSATQAQIRAVIAWALLPSILAFSLCVLALLWLAYIAGGVAPRGLVPALQAITLILGIWGFVILLLMLARAQGFSFWRTIGSAVIAGCIVLIAPLLIRTFLYQPFNIPSAAQMPTLLVGDYLFVSKYAYGYTHYSLPLSPRLFSGRVFSAEPQRGDTVVFRLPKDDTISYIKRVVGLPGDRIQMRNGELVINGTAVGRKRIEDFVYLENGRAVGVKRWRETLPNGASYETLDLQENSFLDNTPEFLVPPGHYFVLGDNRDNSTDSRVMSQVGYVPLENIVGRAAMIFYSVDQTSPNGPSTVRLDRIGRMVH